MCTDFKVDNPCAAWVTSLIASGSPLSPEPIAAVAPATAALAGAEIGAAPEVAADEAVLAAAAGALVAAVFAVDFFAPQPESAIAVMTMPTASGRTEANRVMRDPQGRKADARTTAGESTVTASPT